MSLRSVFAVAPLLVALAVAQVDKYDVFYSIWLNVTPVRLCAVDASSLCFYVPRVDLNISLTKTLAIVTYRCGAGTCAVTFPINEYLLLKYVMSNTSHSWYVIDVPRPGLLYSPRPFAVGPAGSKSQTPATSYTACNKTYPYAYHIAAPGAYNITPLRPPLYLVDLNTCVEYRIAAHTSAVVNITAGWYSLYLAELYPPARKIFYGSYGSTSYAYVLNGTLHAYLTYFHGFWRPSGEGYYILQTGTASHVAQTLVMPAYSYSAFYSQRGPVAYDAWPNFRTYVSALGAVYVAYNIGAPPGDGYHMALLRDVKPPAPAELVYVADDGAGYFLIKEQLPGVGASYITYHRRYAVVHVPFSDGVYLYDTRGLACPMTSAAGAGWTLNRLERSYEIEVCNNNAYTVYVVLYSGTLYGTIVYMYGDRVEPGQCARLRWDGAIYAKPYLRVYTTPQGVCAASNNYTLSTTNYSPGWRHNLVGNNLVPVEPISPDYDYASQLLALAEWLGRFYSNLLGNLSKYLDAIRSSNATAFNLTGFYASQQFLGTIKVDSATSTWLRTTLSELQKWKVVGSSASFGMVSPPAVPTAVAPAAAAAVAVAWAASRRDDDVATAAAVAGIALALFGILMTLIYGTSSLTLVALGVIVAAAAAAWRRIS